MPSKPKNIVFFHPDLGIGGAERLIIDAAVGLQKLGHNVTIFTSHCDKAHCFDEARDGTLDVRVRGNWLFPATILGRFKILLTVLRQLHLLVAITLSGELSDLRPSVFFLDQLSANVPLLRWWWRKDTRILFYCHFPDLLLVQGRRRWWKRIWRVVFDWLEGIGMRRADRIVVNSGFTKNVVRQVWKGLGGDRGLGIVYPCVDTGNQGENLDGTESSVSGDDGKKLWKDKKVVLSINRFERKKNIELAIKAYAGLATSDREYSRLVIAGGYDNRVGENVTYHQDLVTLAESLGLKTATAKNIISALSIDTDTSVLFLLSVPAQLKAMLLETANLLVYTPSNEHFGIVPLEAMLAGTPVLAADSGGPLETVIEEETGWLRPSDNIHQWTIVMHRVLFEIPDEHLALIGERGRRRVISEFSHTKMAGRLDEEIETMVNSPRQLTNGIPAVVVGLSRAVLLAIIVIILKSS